MQIEAPNMSGALESIQSRMQASSFYRSPSLLLHRRKIWIISNPIFYPTCSIPRPFTPILPESSSPRVTYQIFATSPKKENVNHDLEELSQDLIPLPALSTGGQFVKTAPLIGLPTIASKNLVMLAKTSFLLLLWFMFMFFFSLNFCFTGTCLGKLLLLRVLALVP